MSRIASTVRRMLLLLLLLMLIAALPMRVVAQADEAISPATGHAQVVAQGVATLPESEIVWQVEAIAAGAEDGAEVTGPAFVVTAEVGVLASEPERQLDVLLAPGESHFVPEGATATVWSLGEEDAPFQVWSLVAADDASDDALFVSDLFDAPEGERDLNLVRDVLASDEAGQIGNGTYPALLLASGANATAVNADGESATLTAGEPATLVGPLSITATGDDPVTVIVGQIGPAIVEPAEATATAEPEGGIIRLVTFACPAGVDVAAATPETCDRSDDGAGAWTLYGGNLENPAAPASDDGAWVWSGLEAGDYRIVLDDYPESYAGFAIDLYDFAGRDGSEIDVALAGDLPDLTINAYFINPQEGSDEPLGEAALGFIFYDCPPETTTDVLSGSSDPGCTERDTPFPMMLESDALPAALTSSVLLRVSPQPSLEGAWQWTDLPVGDYTLTIAELDPGDSFFVARPCGDQSCPEVGGLGSTVEFAIEDGGFTLIVYRIPGS